MWKKKMACVLAIMALCGTMAAGAADYTILEKAEKVETTVYGTTQTGSLNDRINSLDKLLNGTTTVNGSIQNQTNELYKDVYGSNGSDLSLLAAVNLMQWQYSGQITEEPLLVQVQELEEGIDGKVMSGSLVNRIAALRSALLGNKRYISQSTVIPKGTIVTLQNLDALDSQTAQEGDTVRFTVADDVLVGDVIAIPKGMEAEGTITKARKSGRFGKDGKIEITYHTVRAADGTPVPLIIGEKVKEQYKNTASAVGASAAGAIILGPVGLVGGLFVHGNDVEIPAGTDMYVETADNVSVVGFKENGVTDNLATANHAASGVVVNNSALTNETAPTTDDIPHYGTVAPVELPHSGSDANQQAIVSITPSDKPVTGDVHE